MLERCAFFKIKKDFATILTFFVIGLALHSFHGNFFVRSTDLLALPNINPDSACGIQVAMEDNLTDVSTVCFQAALLYTSSRGKKRCYSKLQLTTTHYNLLQFNKILRDFATIYSILLQLSTAFYCNLLQFTKMCYNSLQFIAIPLQCLGERRIRVHTLCLPVRKQLNEIHLGADAEAIVSLLAKMG